jgi:hypothetical protein
MDGKVELEVKERSAPLSLSRSAAWLITKHLRPRLRRLLRNICRPLKRTRDFHLHLPSHEWLGLDMLSLRDGRVVCPTPALNREFRKQPLAPGAHMAVAVTQRDLLD